MLEPSPRLKREAARIGCDPNHIILADLILSGYSEAEAYDIAYSEDTIMTAKTRISNRERVFSSEGYKRAYDEKKAARRFVSEDILDRGKEDVLKELNMMASKETDTKMKSELLMKIAEIKQMKKDVTSDSEDPVQFFFSLSCSQCPLLQRYNDFIRNKNKGLEHDKWVVEVRPDEMQRIVEQADMAINEARNREKE